MLNIQPQPLYAPRTGPQSYVPPAAGMALPPGGPGMSMPVAGAVPGMGMGVGVGMMPGMPVAAAPVPPMAHRGTLQPGQKVQVGQYEVTVERYLAEGGYAHVYLVHTSTPIQGDTRHVLKRIACASDDILREVGIEVQVMKLLGGHPNIVHLHSATSEPQPDGSSVVYILMEFCAGGGIIDYMNRRLRERLTEKEILQIFVDVCEAVAKMHSFKPPLLHRDLKIENILQSSPTLYKLCDFGSAAAVTPPPSTPAQLRLLEADINKHTTLQYRAPEMVDLSQRRPIDTKSDVWALGVLLYKLCYYTTPFEAHGPVAILTGSYKIPGYPVYSSALNGLIGRMLQVRGTSRPSVFELLEEVHRMRGTRSRFHYDVTSPPPLSPTKPLKSPPLALPPQQNPPKISLSPRPLSPSLSPLSPPAPSLRSHISGPATRSSANGYFPSSGSRSGAAAGGSGTSGSDTSSTSRDRAGKAAEETQRAERGRQAGLQAAMRKGGDGKISPAFTPSSTAASVSASAGESTPGLAWRSEASNSNSKDAAEKSRPQVAAKPSFVAQRLEQLGQPQPQPQAQSGQDRSSSASSLASNRPGPISLPSPSLSLSLPSPALPSRSPGNRAPSQAQARTPAFLSPTATELSAEERFPSLEQLSQELDSAFSPPERALSSLQLSESGPPKDKEKEKEKENDAPWLARRSPSPSKAGLGAGRFEPVSSRSTGVRGSAMLDRPVFSSPSGTINTAVNLRPTAGRAPLVGRPISAEPALSAPRKEEQPPASRSTRQGTANGDSKSPAIPERTNPPMKRLESDFAKPRKRTRKRTSTATEEGEPTSTSEEQKPSSKPRDWLTGSFDADDPTTLEQPAVLPSKPAVLSKPAGLHSEPGSLNSASKPALPQRPSDTSLSSGRNFVRSPEPVNTAAMSPPAEAARTSPFKRHSVAITQPSSRAGLSARENESAAPRLPARPQSGVFSPPTLKHVSSPRPGDKPAFLKNAGKPPSATNLKLDTSPRKSQATLTDNWSPVELKSQHQRKESSEDDAPEDARGGTIRSLRRQFEQPKPVPPPKPTGVTKVPMEKPLISPTSPTKREPAPVTAPDSPTKAFAARFPDLMTLDAQSGGKDSEKTTAASARRSPLPSPNIMDEENEELFGAVPERPTVSSGRNGRGAEAAPAVPANKPSSRPRPQSMFLSSSMMQTMASLQPPPDTSNAGAEKRAPRRGSISDMVSKYEALASPALSKTGQISPSRENPPARSSPPSAASPPAQVPSTSATNLAAPSPVLRPSTTTEQKDQPTTMPVSGTNDNLARRRTVAATSGGGIASAFGPPKAQVGLPGLAKLSSVPERSPSVPVKQTTQPIGDYKPRALPGLAKSPPSPTKQPSYLSAPSNAAPVAPRAASPAAAGLPMRPISPIGMPLPAPKPSEARIPSPSPNVAQSTSASKPSTTIVAPTPRRAEPSPRPPSATSDGVETSFQGVGKLVAQWQKKAEESSQPPKKEQAKPTSWQRLR